MSDEETTEETPVEETPVEETAAKETPAAEAAAPPAAEAEGDGEAAAKPHPKEIRRKARSEHKGEVNPQRDSAARAAERAEERAKKAASRRRWRTRQKAKRAAAPAADPTPVKPHEPGSPKIRQGIVVSDKGDKTITVRIDVARRHPKYEKIVRSSSTLHAHDESNDAHIGDTVSVIECRPMSRSKRWRLEQVMERAK